MPKQERAEIARQSIIRGAAQVFDRYGHAAATRSDVIGHGGVTKGALYFHFKSKEDVARAVVEQQHELSVAAPGPSWPAVAPATALRRSSGPRRFLPRS